MEEEIIESPPAVPGPFFRFADEAAWLTAARAAGFMSTVPTYDEEGEETGTEEVLAAYTADRAIDVRRTTTVTAIPKHVHHHMLLRPDACRAK